MPRAAWLEKLRSKAGSAIYAQRKAIVEPVNGQIKEARGLRRFLLRGLEKVEAEWHLIATTHNLLKLFRYRPPVSGKMSTRLTHSPGGPTDDDATSL